MRKQKPKPEPECLEMTTLGQLLLRTPVEWMNSPVWVERNDVQDLMRSVSFRVDRSGNRRVIIHDTFCK